MIDQHSDHACTTPNRPFVNTEWRLLVDGLEHRTSGYFIAADMIAMRRGDLWEWPLHLSEKNWCGPRAFREAFLAALDAFGVSPDANLARSFALGIGLVAGPGTRVGGEDFVALGELVRPKPPATTRKRSAASEARTPSRRTATPVPQRMGDPNRQRATL